MSQLDAARFREVSALVERLAVVVEALQTEIATLKMRLNSLQGQINASRRWPGPPPEEGEGDAARQ